MTWSAQQYVAFENERTRPVHDLLSAVPRADARSAIDLGCGPGNSGRAYLAPLTPAERAEYRARYEEAVALAYPPMLVGTVLLPFPRLFLVAVR